MPKKILAKSILNKHKKRDAWFLDDYSVNPYAGCATNCLYCYIRGSKYGGDMALGVMVKTNAVELLDKQLEKRASKGEYGIIALSSATDAYQPIEKKFKLTRQLLEIMIKHRFPVHIITKSTLVDRDFDLLNELDKCAILPQDLQKTPGRGVIISFSISTFETATAKVLEPGAPVPTDRLEALARCRQAGFLAGLNYIPTLPFLSDSIEQLDYMVGQAKEYGANFAIFGGLTLFGNGATDCKTLYYNFLCEHYPELTSKYESIYRASSQPTREYSRDLESLSARLCKKYGIMQRIV